MNYLKKDCEMFILSEEYSISGFDCGNDDLNEFFNKDALEYSRQMLSQTNFFREKSTGKTVCAFSFSASSIKTTDLPGSRRKKVKEHIPREKSLKSYPAILIGRLAVSKEFSGFGIGSQLISIIKDFCLINFPFFVRFLSVDAYNDLSVIAFYQKNDFKTVFSSEEQEKETYMQKPSDILRTRYMFYDIMQWKNQLSD
ncbi:MAG: GNAT family N-acetyltransferase [Marinilabiliaceae bacterium]|nr:GNAT family N-acetyltransferase [Marinilabiliaceae bacterium]